MSRRAQENIVAGVLVLVFVAYIVITTSFGPNARLVPLPIATLGLVLVIIQIFRQNLGDARELHIDLFASLTGRVATDDEAPATETELPARFRREIEASVFVAVFVGLIALLGPIPAVFVFTTGFFLRTRHFPAPKAVAIGVAFTAALYALFVFGLQLQLYHGLLQPLLNGDIPLF